MRAIIGSILVVGIMITIILYWIYYRSSQLYGKKQYILEEVGSGKKTKIVGNTINIRYENYLARVCKGEDDVWSYTIKEKSEEGLEEREEFKKLGRGEYIEVGNIKFEITSKRKRGLIIFLPIGIIAISSVLLLIRGVSLINDDKVKTKKNESVEMVEDKIQEAETKDLIEEDPKDENLELDKDIQENESIREEMQPLEENDKIVDMHTVVLENDNLFQNSKIIDWEWEYEGNANNMRRYLKNAPSELGINVSYYQEDIDWEKVKADGVDFAIIRLGRRGQETGEIKIDSKFKENMDGATSNDIKVGVYFYSQAINKDEMDEEINEILNAVKEYELKYPIGIRLDCLEDCRTYELSREENKEEYIDLIKYFCIRIKQNGYTPMILGDIDWFQQFPDDIFDGYYKWIYSPNSAPENIDNCVVWEYRENTLGVIDGIDLYVSVNVGVFDWEND